MTSISKFLLSVIGILSVSNIVLWQGAMGASNNMLKVAFLDVGQGDAIFIEAPNGRQMLIDGGKDKSVLYELGSVMRGGDKSIDILIATHPDADHIGGLDDVLASYDIDHVITNGHTSNTNVSRSFEKFIDEEQVSTTVAERGMRIMLDTERNIYFDILYPTRNLSAKDTNALSIIGRLVYGEREFLLTGDAGVNEEQKLLNWCRECIASDVLKAGHHGSKTSTSKSFVDAVAPIYAIISASANNTYGHPHPSVMNTLENKQIQILETAKEGTIIFETNGEELRVK